MCSSDLGDDGGAGDGEADELDHQGQAGWPAGSMSTGVGRALRRLEALRCSSQWTGGRPVLPPTTNVRSQFGVWQVLTSCIGSSSRSGAVRQAAGIIRRCFR